MEVRLLLRLSFPKGLCVQEIFGVGRGLTDE